MRSQNFSGAISAAGVVITAGSASNAAATVTVDYTTGTLVGTVIVEVRVPGGGANDWCPVNAGITAQGIINTPILYGDLEWRVRCSAFTSGTGTARMTLAA